MCLKNNIINMCLKNERVSSLMGLEIRSFKNRPFFRVSLKGELHLVLDVLNDVVINIFSQVNIPDTVA